MDTVTSKNAKQYDAHANEWSAAMKHNVGHKYLEKPAMEKQLPDSLKGRSVLCIGVGSGEELDEIQKKEPKEVVGIDISTELLKIAKSRFPDIEFITLDMTDLKFPSERFDFVYSSLTFHYEKEWSVLLGEVKRVLKKEGGLLFSTHHPEYWSRKTPTENTYKNKKGITITEHTALLPGNVEIIYYNHPDVDSILNEVTDAGFEVQSTLEPSVIEVLPESLTSEEKEEYLWLKGKNADSPLFLIIKAVKR